MIELIAWRKDPACADTALRVIYVYEDFVVSVPNVFSPNGDQANDLFDIRINQPATVSFNIQNRWGETLVQNDPKFFNASTPITLWDGNSAPEGVYFYTITVERKNSEPQSLTGFFHLEH